MRHGFVHAIAILASQTAPSTASLVVFNSRLGSSGRRTSCSRLAEAKALLTPQPAFDSSSDSSNLPLIDFSVTVRSLGNIFIRQGLVIASR
jgi:hypothetical protein